MKLNISLACKKFPFFPPVKTVLRQLSPNSSPKSRANPNTDPNRGGGTIFFGRIVPTPVKTKETKNRKEIKNNRRKKK